MANWVKCTHKGDEQPVYVNVDAAMSMRWIESDNATIIVYAGGEIDVVRVCFESNRYAGRMSAAVQSNIARLVRRYFDSGTKRLDVTWYGGEPLLAFSVVERLSKRFLSLCEEFGREYSAEIVTNGTLMSHEKAQQLASWKVKRAQITLDGVPELHDARRVPKNRKPTFCTILDGIDAAAAHMHVSVRINVCRKVAARLEELLQILAARGLNRVVSVYVAPLQKVEDRKTLPSRGPQARVSSVAPQPDGEQLDALDGREAADLELRFNDLLWKYGFAVSNRLPEPRCTTCMADKEHSWLIEANGDVQKCYWTAGLRAEAAGRLTEDGIAPREPYRKWQDWTAFRNTGCLQCIMLPICLGRCPLKHLNHKSDYCPAFKHNWVRVLARAAGSAGWTIGSCSIAIGRRECRKARTRRPMNDPTGPEDAASAPGRTRTVAAPIMIKRAGRRSRYRLRKQLPQPVFGQIKHVRGFRQFLLRDLDKVRGEPTQFLLK